MATAHCSSEIDKMISDIYPEDVLDSVIREIEDIADRAFAEGWNAVLEEIADNINTMD